MRTTNFVDRQEGAKQLAVRLKKTVALVGMMGSGKTAVGTALAKRLAVPFLDSDAAIVGISSGNRRRKAPAAMIRSQPAGFIRAFSKSTP